MTTKQTASLAHLECTLKNYITGVATARKVHGAINRCRSANVTTAIIKQSTRDTFRGQKDYRSAFQLVEIRN